ncbi:hypothetical protein SAMD00019534_014300, partial [Acytostelium subglobosum LB1]|uniref:hypothetical protein n=1 Tax=Acytostelium subglobosum LB1 TaxID=1410327 RepID=UPI000644F9EC
MMETTSQQQQSIVVTGSTGYIASAIIEQLLLKGYRVIAIVRDLSNKAKYQHLTELSGANTLLTFAGGDLESADYLTIFKGVDYVMHCGSPYIYTSEDPQRDIVQPAINGNLRVLEAAAATPSIKKVIITSSTAAIIDSAKKKDVYTEEDWNESATIATPYMYSKYLAERAAMEFAPSHFQLIFVNPSFVVGRGLAKHINTSLTTFTKSLCGSINNRYVGLVDLRDVVDTHLHVLESSTNMDRQRKMVCSSVMTFTDMVERVQKLFPQYDFVDHSIDQSTITPNSALHKYRFESVSPISIGRPYYDLDDTFKQTVEYLIATGHLNPKPKVE